MFELWSIAERRCLAISGCGHLIDQLAARFTARGFAVLVVIAGDELGRAP